MNLEFNEQWNEEWEFLTQNKNSLHSNYLSLEEYLHYETSSSSSGFETLNADYLIVFLLFKDL